MAEKIAHDVVTKVQSVRDPSPTDVSAAQSSATSAQVAPEKSSPATQIQNTLADNATTIDSIHNQGSTVGTSQAVAEEREAGAGNAKSASPSVGPAEDSQVNGLYNDQQTNDPEVVEDGATRSAGVEDSVSGESTEGVLKEPGENQEQARPNTLKKSTTFKPVSVTKNFLAKAGTPTAPAAKPTAAANNAASSMTSQGLARPRLVAKSASGQRASTPKSISLGTKTDKDSGPDPNQVWNRNRVSAAAPQQATPKHLTDEELRQQYGISLASRLQEDGDGKEAKWADIDDDEDDWAPETIEWTDGTKTSLAPVEVPPTPREDKSTTSSTTGKDMEAERPKTTNAKSLSSVGPNATVLKLGSGGEKKGSSLALKVQSDKPTLVAKPSASTPLRSPWASLPPVEKVPPIAINPVAPNQPTRFGQRDPHGFDAMPPPPVHAKEIAADDFSRQSRDNRNGAPNQLFNSHSGQYEPVKEQRRASMRKDQNNFRTHSVLQRPQPGDSNSPAEPSPAFQTSRSNTGQDSGHWNRRRASSSVSGDSANADRRMSLGQTTDMSKFSEDPRHRRGSQIDRVLASSGIQAMGPNRSISPAESRGHALVEATSKASRQSSSSEMPTPSPHLQKAMQDTVGNTSMPTTPYQDAAAMTADIKKVMREKGKEALKRRQEEEDKEEKARRERIRIKMESLGLTDDKIGKKEKDKEKEATAVTEQAAPAEIPSVTEKRVEEKATESTPAPTPSIAELPKVNDQPPTRRIVEPRPVNGVSAQVNELIADVKAETAALRPFTEKGPATSLDSRKSTINGNLNKQASLSSQLPSPENRQTYASKESTQQAWPSTGLPSPGPVTDWSTTGSSSGMTTHSSTTANLWGPPPHQRALGNGDFNSSVERLQHRNQTYQPQHLPPVSPQPIGPLRAPYQAPNQLSPSRVPEGLSRPASDSSTQFNRHSPAAMATTEAFQHQVPRQDARTTSDVNKATKPAFSEATTGSTPSAWAQFSATVERNEAAQNEKMRRERAVREMEDAKRGVAAPELNLSAMSLTWRKVSSGEDMDGRRTAKADEATVNGTGTVPVTEDAPRMPSKSPSSATTGSNLPTAPPIRSKFFPFGQASPSLVPRISSQATTANRSLSPPPPDSDDHPAYVGFKDKPFVNLPKPIPTVRLPPSLATIKEVPVNVEAAPVGRKSPPNPVASEGNWQQRFDGLFGRTPAPSMKPPSAEKKFANVESSSKVPFELASLEHDAVITLPALPIVPTLPSPPPKAEQPASGKNIVPTILHTVAEEELFEEDREMGSKPTVRLPDHALSSGWNVAKTKTYRPRPQKQPTEIESQSKLPFSGDDSNRSVIPSITVLIYGMPRPRSITRRGQQNYSLRYAHQTYGMRSQQGPMSPNSSRGKPNHRGRPSRESNSSASVPNTPTPQRPAVSRNAVQNGYPQAPVSRPSQGMSWSRVATNHATVGRV